MSNKEQAKYVGQVVECHGIKNICSIIIGKKVEPELKEYRVGDVAGFDCGGGITFGLKLKALKSFK